jgi:hypothetical protein
MALSFATDIRPLFTARDIETMKEFGGFDLANLEDVRSHATKIYFRLSNKTMPCDRPWPDQQIERFRRWIEGGMPP